MKDNNKIMVINSLALFVISFMWVLNVTDWINSIAIFGLVAHLKTFEFWKDIIIMVVLCIVFGYILYGAFRKDMFSYTLFKKTNDIVRIKICNTLYNIGILLRVLSAITAIAYICTNFANFGFGWVLIYNLNVSAKLYLVGEAFELATVIISPSLTKYPEEYTGKLFYGYLKEIYNTEDKNKNETENKGCDNI